MAEEIGSGAAAWVSPGLLLEGYTEVQYFGKSSDLKISEVEGITQNQVLITR
jgi:hypothetical protein